MPFHPSSSIYCPWSMLQMVTWVHAISDLQAHLPILLLICTGRKTSFFCALAVHLFLFGKRLPVLARERLNEPEPKVNLLS